MTLLAFSFSQGLLIPETNGHPQFKGARQTARTAAVGQVRDRRRASGLLENLDFSQMFLPLQTKSAMCTQPYAALLGAMNRDRPW